MTCFAKHARILRAVVFKMYLFKFFVLPLFADLQGLQTTRRAQNNIFSQDQVILICVQFVEGQANIENILIYDLYSIFTILYLCCTLHYIIFFSFCRFCL